jgi:hypothetical protein
MGPEENMLVVSAFIGILMLIALVIGLGGCIYEYIQHRKRKKRERAPIRRKYNANHERRI